MKIRTMGLKKIVLALAVILVIGCTPEKKLVIVSTNDMHSAIDAFPRLATLVDSLRKEYPGHLLLVDAGDRWTGNPYVDYATEAGRPIIELMNELGYDIATFGNHEFDNGVDTLAARTKFATFRNVLANADMTGSVMPHIDPYGFITVDGLRIGFLGLVTTSDNGHPAGKESNMGGIKFFDPWQTAAKYSNLRDSCGLYVAITHIGLEEDSLLATERPELDLIIGGHSHDAVVVGRKINNTVVTQTGKSLHYAGVTTVTYKGDKVTGIENHLVRLDTIPAASHFQSMVDVYNNDPYFRYVVGTAAEPMNKLALMNLYSDVMRIGAGAQFAFYNLGGMRASSLKAGEITRGDIFMAEPFRNQPNIFMMTLDEIKDLIINKFNGEGKESHTMDLYPSGMSYKIITDGEGNATDVFFNFKATAGAGGKYKVALSDYVSESYDFPQKAGGKPTGLLITDLAMDYIAKHSPIKPNNENRVEIE